MNIPQTKKHLLFHASRREAVPQNPKDVLLISLPPATFVISIARHLLLPNHCYCHVIAAQYLRKFCAIRQKALEESGSLLFVT